MGATVDIGLAVSSHVASTNATGTFDNVTMSKTTAANVAPTVTLTSPADGATFTEPATVALSASASDSDGTVARVDFFSGATLIGSTTTAPYSASWNNVAAGTYSLTAVATD